LERHNAHKIGKKRNKHVCQVSLAEASEKHNPFTDCVQISEAKKRKRVQPIILLSVNKIQHL